MCLLIAVPDACSPDPARLRAAALSNPDGFGWALLTGDQLLVARSLDIDEAVETYMSALRAHAGPSLFHLRLATHGTRGLENVHPYAVDDDGLVLFAHNGILSLPTHDWRSDSRTYAEDILDAAQLDSPTYVLRVERYAVEEASRFVVLRPAVVPDDRLLIFNERSGHWDDDGCWYSNRSYERRRDRVPAAWRFDHEHENLGQAHLEDELVWICSACEYELDCWDCGACAHCGEVCLCRRGKDYEQGWGEEFDDNTT